MTASVRYATTSDGIDVAYEVTGSGPSLLITPPLPISDLGAADSLNTARGHQPLRDAAQYVARLRYDARGFGLSSRSVSDFSPEAMARDIEAVADAAGFEKFILYATSTFMSPAAITFAATHPNRLSHLVLEEGTSRGCDVWANHMAVLLTLLRTDPESAIDTFVHWHMPWVQGERDAAETMRTCADSATFHAFFGQFAQCDVSPDLSRVTARTLVLHHDNYPGVSLETCRRLARNIAGGELTVLTGTESERNAATIGAIYKFLTGSQQPPVVVSGPPVSGTAVILFADIVDSTALTERLGDSAFRAKARELDAALRGVMRENAGTPIEGKLLGDGVLAVFTSARQAIEAALACGKAGDEGGLPLHLGLHAGDVIRESDPDGRDNVYGGAVNIASRIAGLSAAGEVLVSETVRSLARTSAGVRFEDRGEQALKGVGEAVRVWAVVASRETGDMGQETGGV